MFIYIHGISFIFLLACLYFGDLDLTQAESYGILKHPLLVSFVILQVYYYSYNIQVYQYKFSQSETKIANIVAMFLPDKDLNKEYLSSTSHKHQ
jgi:hypothetical protein